MDRKSFVQDGKETAIEASAGFPRFIQFPHIRGKDFAKPRRTVMWPCSIITTRKQP
jgi:hypothetical protein